MSANFKDLIFDSENFGDIKTILFDEFTKIEISNSTNFIVKPMIYFEGEI